MSFVTQTATVAWGFTMADLDQLAWAATFRMSRSRFMDVEDRYTAAWHGIAVVLCTSSSAPTGHDLYAAGIRAVSEAINTENHHHGTPSSGPSAGQRNEAVGFAKYWRPIKQDMHDGFSDHLVEAISLPAVLGVLTPLQYETIITLAAFDNDYKAAAASLGVEHRLYLDRVRKARQKVKAAWFGDETPVTPGNPTDRCRSGHDRATYGKKNSAGSWECQRCKRDSERRRRAKNRPIAKTTLRSLQEAG